MARVVEMGHRHSQTLELGTSPPDGVPPLPEIEAPQLGCWVGEGTGLVQPLGFPGSTL